VCINKILCGVVCVVDYIISLLVYLYMVVCLICLADKLGRSEYGILLFIPIMNLYFLLKIADLNGLLLILFCIPVLNYFLLAFCFMRISAFLGKSPWLGLGMFVPIVNLVIMGYLAFFDHEPKDLLRY